MKNIRKFLSNLRIDLGLQILALYVLFVVPIGIAAFTFDRIASQRLEDDIMSADLALAQAIAQETDAAIQSALHSVEQLSEFQEVVVPDIERMEILFTQVSSVRPDVNLIYRLGSDGIMLYHYPTGPSSTLGVDFSFRDYFQRAVSTRQSLVSLGRISPTTQQPVATTVMPLWDEEEFMGVVATNIKLQFLSETLQSISESFDAEKQFDLMIIDHGGQVIASPDPANLLTDLNENTPSVTTVVLGGGQGNLVEKNTEGTEMLYSYAPISHAGWGVVISRPTEIAFATPFAFHQGVLFLIVTFLSIGIFFWIALSRRVIQPIETLAQFSHAIGENEEVEESTLKRQEEFSKRPDQMGHLIRSFIRMEKSIQARIKELSTLLETSAAVVSILDPGMVLDKILEQVELLLNVEKSVIVALDETAGVFRARASRGLTDTYVEKIAISPNEYASVTMRAIKVGLPIQVSDTETDPSYSPFRSRSRSEGFRAVMAIPLNTVHAPPSALVIYHTTPKEFSRREINLLTNFANHAAMAIENAELYARSDARLQDQTRRLEALIQSLDVGLILENLDGKVIYVNRSVSEIFGMPISEIIGNPVARLMDSIRESATGSKEEIWEAFDQLVNSDIDQVVEFALEFPTGRRFFRAKNFLVTDPADDLIGRGQIIRDITKDYELDRMRSSLISTVSHELRTPLAAIKGYATTLLAEDVDWDINNQTEFLEIISQEADRLSELVNDLLDMSRIEAGNLTLSREMIEIEDIINSSIHRVYPNPGEHLTCELAADLPNIYADYRRLEAVFRNLIENAVKYSGNTAQIKITAQVVNHHLEIRISDNGPGIPVSQHEKIFESFVRIENGKTREISGAGLGLAICRGFIQAHGGEIWLEPVSKGTCVAFSLPLGFPEN